MTKHRMLLSVSFCHLVSCFTIINGKERMCQSCVLLMNSTEHECEQRAREDTDRAGLTQKDVEDQNVSLRSKFNVQDTMHGPKVCCLQPLSMTVCRILKQP